MSVRIREPLSAITAFVLEERGGSPGSPMISNSQGHSCGHTLVTFGDFKIQTAATPSRISPIGTSAQTSTAPWTPTAENLIFNTTVPQGTFAALGWIFDGIYDGNYVLDGFAKNITVYYTVPGQDEEPVFSLSNEPSPDDPRFDFCGYFPGLWLYVPMDSDILGTRGGVSSLGKAPSQMHPLAWPLSFDSTTVEFEGAWEVVAAEYKRWATEDAGKSTSEADVI
ncbi:hypothetical protein C8J57DRAFT_1243204 [Mycena rebaudengoi]|nr:hypothetical protein C8J57DRAFT_1243204 [Mycena rebaudengoi]